MQLNSVTLVCKGCGERGQSDFAFCEACGKPLLGKRDIADVDSPARPSPQPGEVRPDESLPVCVCGGQVFDALGYCEACGRRIAASHVTELKALGNSVASASHRGLRHADNQDAVGMLLLPGGLALAVADGVSTSCHARAAADLACSEALATLCEFSSVEPADRLTLAVKRAHAAICKLPYGAAHMAEPQATIVLALVEGQQLWYAWVGDSRLYVLGSGEATQLTVDDSWLNAQLAGGVAPQDAEKDENAHCITQCLGMRDGEPHVHIGSHALTVDMSILLCSDGLWNYLETPAALAALVAACGTGLTLVQRCVGLVDYANAAGGHDNITVALFSSAVAVAHEGFSL